MLKKKKFLIIIIILVISVFIWFINPLSFKDHSYKLIQKLNVISTLSNIIKGDESNKSNESSSENHSQVPLLHENSREIQKNIYQNQKNEIEESEPEIRKYPIEAKKQDSEKIITQENTLITEASKKERNINLPPGKVGRLLPKDNLREDSLRKVIKENSLSISILLCIIEIEKSIALGQPYHNQIDILEDLLNKSNKYNTKLDLLINNANDGMQSRIKLYDEFKLIRYEILSLPPKETKNMHLIEKAYNKILSLVIITNNPDNASNKLRVILDEIEKELINFNIDNILIQYRKLSEPNKQVINAWIRKLELIRDTQLVLLNIKKSAIKNLTDD